MCYLLGLFLLVSFGLLWCIAGRLASPERRKLQAYHQDWFESSGMDGVSWGEHLFLENQVPTIIVRPAPQKKLLEKGRVLREQLKDQKIALDEYGKERGLLVMLHGRNGRKEDLLPAAERFCAVGFICVLPDLPSHGESEIATVGFGVRDFERHLPGALADEVAQYLKVDLPQSLWGISMGGSFAVHSASQEPERWNSLVIVSSFDALDGVLQRRLAHYSGPLTQPVYGLIQWMALARGGVDFSEVRPVDLVSHISVPTLVIHGDTDIKICFKISQDGKNG